VASADVEIAVIGAGIDGLAAGAARQRRGVAVFEAGGAPGGVLRSERIGGWLVERGPALFRLTPGAAVFLASRGLLGELVRAGPEARIRALLVDGRLVPVPSGLASAVATPLLSARGKLRVLAEPFVRRGDPTVESVAEFVARRLGREALERLVAPFLVGVYAGDETRLGAEAVFPQLAAYERASGSIARGALASARRGGRTPAAWTGSFSTRDGVAGLARAVAEQLGSRLHLRTPVLGVAREGDALRLETPAGAWRARRAVVALPAWRAADLLRPLDAELGAGLAAIEYAPIASVALGIDAGRARGVGFLVPAREKLDLLGALFTSRVFPDRAPPGRDLATCLLGGARWPGAAEADDRELVARATAGLDRALAIGSAETIAITRWPHAIPQPGRDHPARVKQLRERAARAGVALAGGYLFGVSVANALDSGELVARSGEAIPYP
jgi:oxygen-dependent protoporphyrinogen oxidase